MAGWTVESLAAHLDKMFCLLEKREDERDRRMMEGFELRDRALTLALENMNIRMAGVNEFRAALSDISLSKVDRAEYAVSHRHWEEKIDLVREELAQTRGKDAGSLSVRTLLFAVIAATGGIVGIIVAFVNLA